MSGPQKVGAAYVELEVKLDGAIREAQRGMARIATSVAGDADKAASSIETAFTSAGAGASSKLEQQLGADSFRKLETAANSAAAEVEKEFTSAASELESEFDSAAAGAASAIDSKLGSSSFNKIENASKSAASEVEKDFKRAAAEASRKLDGIDIDSSKFDSGGGSAGGAFLGGFTGALTGGGLEKAADIAIDVFMAAWDSAMADADLTAGIEASLGATEAVAQEYGAAASAVYADGWGDSKDAVAEAVTAIGASFDGLGQDEVEELATQALVMSDVFGYDVPSSVAAAGIAVKNGLADNAQEAFDLITAGAQEMPVALRDELLEASNEYGVFFAQLGFSGEETFGLLANAAEGGIYGIDKTGDAIKELATKASDLADTGAQEALEAMGLSGEEMANKLLAGGDTAKGAFDQIIAGLLGIEDPGEQAKAAVALLGTPIEDLSKAEIPAFISELQNMTTSLGDVDGAAQATVDVMGGTLSAQFETFRRGALQALADMITNYLLPALSVFVAWVTDSLIPLLAQVYDTWQPLIDGLVGLFGLLAGSILVHLEMIANIIELFLAIISGDWSRAWEEIGQIFSGAWGLIIAGLEGLTGPIGDWIAGLIESFANMALGIAETIGSFVVGFIASFVGLHADVIKIVIGFAAGLVQQFATLAATILVGIVTWVANLVSTIGTLPGRAAGALSTLASNVRSRVDSMASSARDAVSNWVSGTVSTIGTVPGRAAGALSSLASQVLGKFTTMASNVKSAVTGWVSDVVSLVASIPGKMASALSGLAGQVRSSFLGAMKSAVNSVINAANNFIPNSVGVGPFRLDLPANPIPRWYGRGGIFNQVTYGALGERPEVLIPMRDRSRAMQLMDESGLGAEWDRANGGGPVLAMYGTTIMDGTDIELVAQRVNAANALVGVGVD